MGNGKNSGVNLLLAGLASFGIAQLVKPFLPYKVVLNWAYPKSFDSVLRSEASFTDWGIYVITNKHKGVETLLYIGKAYRTSFYDRLSEHKRNWLDDYPGKKYVRLGSFERPITITKSAVHDVESALIFEHQPEQNIMQKISYNPKYERIIHSEGNRGPINRVIRMSDHF